MSQRGRQSGECEAEKTMRRKYFKLERIVNFVKSSIF